jgi:hypothetical protein
MNSILQLELQLSTHKLDLIYLLELLMIRKFLIERRLGQSWKESKLK